MKRNDILKAVIETGSAFLKKRGGICNGYAYDVFHGSFRRIQIPKTLQGTMHLFGMTKETVEFTADPMPDNAVRIVLTNKITVRICEGDSLMEMCISISDGEITKVSCNKTGGHLVEEILPVFTAKMHELRYGDGL